MAAEALDLSRGTLAFPFRATVPATSPAVRHLQTLLRQWRRQRSRKHLLAQVLAETSDPRLIEEAGFGRPAPGLLDLWAQALLYQHQAPR